MKDHSSVTEIEEKFVSLIDPLTILINENVYVHDAHCHYSKDLEEYLLTNRISSISLMPSWIKEASNTLKNTEPNDISNPNKYFNSIELIKNTFKNWKGKIFFFIPIDFSKPSSLFESNLKKYNPAGIKIHPFQNYKISRSYLDSYFSLIRKNNLIVYVHTDVWPNIKNQQYSSQMKNNFGKMVELYPDIQFIMGHAGNSDSWLFLWKFFKKNPNVIAETSLSPAPQELEKVIKKNSFRSIIFGSNFPFTSAKVEMMKIFKIHNTEKQYIFNIFGKNAIDLLRNRPYISINEN